MSHGDGGVTAGALGHEEQRHRFADDEAAADNDDLGSGGIDAGGDEEALATERGAGDEGGRILHGEPGHVDGMESVDILARVDREGDGVFVDVLRRGGLDEDPVDGRIGIERRDEIEEFLLRGGGGKLELAGVHAERGAGAVLVADVGPGGGIFSNEDNGQSRGDAACFERLDTGFGFEFDFGGDRLAINEFHNVIVLRWFQRVPQESSPAEAQRRGGDVNHALG